ncbi:spore germination protein [Paenibacillus riograndensis]|uniref:GerA spore germination protein n=1 Tax=Paenibacillus riograndensis SBR5 TaxID=1073571 RepID=A0A0E4H9T0_9BACL|nr:spore germination protein [Paenibacillus riograndensis]CQR55281.1 GerA spore germination protein [Paenibacillus riograndensis SBR5]
MQRKDQDTFERMEQQLQEHFHKSNDFARKQFKAGEVCSAYYLSSLVDIESTFTMMNQLAPGEELSSLLHSNSWAEDTSSWKVSQYSDALLQGRLVLFLGGRQSVVVDPVAPELSRSVSTTNSENPLLSAFDAFTEDIDINIGLLRKKIVSDRLVIETRTSGTKSTKKLAVVYLEGAAQPKVVESIKKKLEENRGMELTTVRDLTRILGHPQFTLTPTYISSEMPNETMQNMLNGKVVILIDQFSFAFAFPAIVADLWSTTMDVNYPQLFQNFLRFLRIGALILAITLPGLYVVLNSVNPELLRIQLAITVAKSREGVPYPSLIEMLLVLVLLEMIIEATIRLPKNIGPTMTMIGGILLGQAIVQAKLVSNLLIIILVASAISNFALTSYMNASGIRIYKYVVLLASAFFGIWGLEAAIIWLVLYFASLTISTVPYLSFSVKGEFPDE